MSQGETLITPTRSGTLKKKSSMKKSGSVKRTGSRRSSRAGSVRSLALHPGAMEDEQNSAFNTPVPLSGNPTDVLASRFQREFISHRVYDDEMSFGLLGRYLMIRRLFE